MTYSGLTKEERRQLDEIRGYRSKKKQKDHESELERRTQF